MTKPGAYGSLHFAARPRVIARYFGQSLIPLAVVTAVPAVVSLSSGHSDIALRYFAITVLLGSLGALGARLRCTDRIQPNEALVVSALVFLVPGCALAFPLMGYGIPFIDAVFEAFSGVTTTGLSTLGSVEDFPRSFHFARAWAQWAGGLGVIVFAVAFMIPSGLAAHRLGFDDREAGDYIGSTRGSARKTVLTYSALTCAGILLCLAAGVPWFEAVVHTMAAISTGGFATSDSSLAVFGPMGRTAISVISVLGAISFSLYFTGIRGFLRSSQMWTLLGLIAVGTLLVKFFLTANESSSSAEQWSHSAWMLISAQTTAGFSTLSTAELPAGALLVLTLSMLIGGGVGSTAGGLKVLRLVIFAKLLVARIQRVSMPHNSRLVVKVDGTRLESDELEAAVTLTLATAAVVFVTWLLFVWYGYEPLNALFDCVSALCTVGLSAGVVGPDLEPVLKGALCANMLMGRVEILAVLILLFPGTWLGKRHPSQ